MSAAASDPAEAGDCLARGQQAETPRHSLETLPTQVFRLGCLR
jgi:hypothetical protein